MSILDAGINWNGGIVLGRGDDDGGMVLVGLIFL